MVSYSECGLPLLFAVCHQVGGVKNEFNREVTDNECFTEVNKESTTASTGTLAGTSVGRFGVHVVV